jgi:FkbM family methyltransferase
MKELILQLLRLPGVIARVDGLPFDRAYRRRLLLTHLGNTFYRRGGYPEKLAELAGGRVRYCNYEAFVYLFREIFLGGEYFFNTAATKPNILDCGGNIGMAMLYFKARWPLAEITCFEPDESAFACLKENVALNRLDGVRLIKKAVSGKDGEISFWRASDKEGALGNTILENPGKTRVSVESARLSAYVDRRVDFLKLDVEGAESEVLRELSDTGKLGLIDQLYLEYHLHMAGEDDDLAKLLGLLENAGFGYQVGGELGRPLAGPQFQTLGVYAYNKASFGAVAGRP